MVRWTRTAQAQLLQLDEYLTEKNPAAADAIVDRIYTIIETLGDFPLAGHPGRVEGTREMAVPSTPYLVAYRLHDEDIQILAIMHGAQRWPAAFKPPPR